MDPIKYLELAVSKDDTRYNMTSIYRDTDCMVATDGFRLHLVGGLSKIDKPHLLNGSDAQFPDYTQVVPQSTQLLAEIRLDKKQLKRLREYVAFTGKQVVSRFSIDDKGLFLSTCEGNITASILLEAREYHHSLSVTGLKAAQLCDAIIPDTLMHVHTGTKEHSPLVIESMIYNTKAIIMPCRVN